MRSRTLPRLDPVAICDDYRAGVNVWDLARRHRCDSSTVSQVLKENGVFGLGEQRRREARRGPRPHLWTSAKRPEITDTTWAYMAGLFDGEGTLSHEAPGPRQRLGWRVAIAQLASTGLCEWIRETLGCGSVTNHRGARINEMGNWRSAAQLDVLFFLRGVEPYVRIKRTKTLEAIEAIARQLEGS